MDLHARAWATLARLHELCGRGAPGGDAGVVGGYCVSTVPQAPDSPWQNVAVPVADRLDPAPLAQWFAAREARTWGVWAERDAPPPGLEWVVDSVAMAAPIDRIDCSGARGERADLAAVGAVNDVAYAHLEPLLERVTPLLEGRVRAFGIEDSSVALCVEHEQDAGIFYVATLPRDRGRGLARAVVKRALTDARERGCTTTSLQASEMGAPLYESLGYERTAPITLWQHAS